MKDYSTINSNQLEEFLGEVINNTELSFLENSEKKNELIEKAKAKGIDLKDNIDLIGIEAIFVFADKPNRNGAILPEEALIKALPTLIGKPINVKHERQFVIGHIIDYSYTKKTKMVKVYGVTYKSCFGELMDELKKDFNEKKLTVSYECWCPESKRKILPDGTYELHQQTFAGMALLPRNVQPAVAEASVLDMALLRNKEYFLEVASTFNQDEIIISSLCKTDKREDTNIIGEKKMPEELKNIEKSEVKKIKCSKCGEEVEISEEIKEEEKENFVCSKCKEKPVKAEEEKPKEVIEEYEESEIEESKKLTTEKRNALSDDDFAVVVEKDGKKIRKYPINDEAHVRNALARLGNEKNKEELRNLGVDVEKVIEKVQNKAKEMNIEVQEKSSEQKQIEEPQKAEEVVVEKPVAVNPYIIKYNRNTAEEVIEYLDTVNNELVVRVSKMTEERMPLEQELATIKEELKTKEEVIIKLEKEKIEAIEKSKFYQEQAKEVLTRRTELGKFSENLTDEELLDTSKYKIATLEKANYEYKNRIKEAGIVIAEKEQQKPLPIDNNEEVVKLKKSVDEAYAKLEKDTLEKDKE